MTVFQFASREFWHLKRTVGYRWHKESVHRKFQWYLRGSPTGCWYYRPRSRGKVRQLKGLAFIKGFVELSNIEDKILIHFLNQNLWWNL